MVQIVRVAPRCGRLAWLTGYSVACLDIDNLKRHRIIQSTFRPPYYCLFFLFQRIRISVIKHFLSKFIFNFLYFFNN